MGLDMMDEIFMRSMVFSGLTGLDVVTLLAMGLIAALYFFAPVVGYSASHRGLLMASLWMLIAKMGLALLKMSILFFEMLDGKTSGSGPKFMEGPGIFILFSLLESILFILAMVLFVCGLLALRRVADGPLPVRRFDD
jgi:hypothetical protein